MTFAAPVILAALLVAVSAAQSPGLRVLPEGRLPDDRRLGPLVDLNGYFPFAPCASRDAWSERAERLRRQLFMAAGLWPMPTRTPPEAVVHGRVDRDGYTVEKVFLQSYSGHFVTGNLYRPKGAAGDCLPYFARMGTGPTADFTTMARKRCGRKSPRGPSGSSLAGDTRFRPAACNWRAWAAWSSFTTWWDTPTACSSHTVRARGLP